MLWMDGASYEGEWSGGLMHGYGIEKRGDGSIRHKGQFLYDKPVR